MILQWNRQFKIATGHMLLQICYLGNSGYSFLESFFLTEKIEDFGSCLMPMDITVAISNMIYQFVQKLELNIHVTNRNCDVYRLNPRSFHLEKTRTQF